MTTFPGCRSCTDPPPSQPSASTSVNVAACPPTADGDPLCDGHLVHAMANGSTEALSELFTRHAGTVLAHLLNRGLARDAAEDAVQETFLSAWKSASGFHEGSALGWLMRIAQRRAADTRRGQCRRAALDERVAQRQCAAPVAPSAEDCLLAASPRYAAVAVALAELPPAQRDVIELRYVHGLSVQQTAERLGIATGTVKSHASRGCAQLREWLRARGEGGEGDDGERGGRVPRPRP
ncbi:RNA polymerase, sigma-24 subunit, RpoE, ECF subfamily [Actinobacteria bacterium OK074]|nr:RNA polymerase, sigma-24 subunit, RpoE, ECF subfamily [Actinobacteria bacterium OK074]